MISYSIFFYNFLFTKNYNFLFRFIIINFHNAKNNTTHVIQIQRKGNDIYYKQNRNEEKQRK